MENVVVSIVGAVLGGGAIAAVFGYLSSRRVAAGSIKTSEATVLWNAAEQIREELRNQVADQDEVIDAMETKVAAMKKEVEKFRVMANTCHQELGELQLEFEALRRKVDRDE